MKTKLEQWNEIPEASQWLSKVLSDPMGKFFMQVLEERSELKLNFATPPAFITANGAALAGRMLGYETCLANIRALSEGAKAPSAQISETYGVTTPDQATE